MSEERIQCPECDKRYKLPANPPATFECRQCGTLMDLSDFGGAPEPEPAEVAAPAAGGGAPATRRQRARGGGGARRSRSRGGGGARRSSARRGGGRGGYDDYDDGGGRGGYRGRQKQGNPALVLGLVAIAVLAVVVVVVMNQREEVEDPGPVAEAPKTSGTPGLSENTPVKKPGEWKKDLPGGDPTAKTDGDDEPLAPIRKKKRSKRIRLSTVTIKKFDWPEEVDEATRPKVEEAIENLMRGGRDGIEAADYLVGLGRPVAGRLISQFKVIEESPGLDSREGKSMLGAVDNVLRKIDGWIERRWEEEKRIQHFSTPSFVMGIMRRWTYWWENDVWKDDPRDPWDPHVDDWDDPDRKKAKAAAKKKEEERKAKGFSKPAGR